MKDPILDSYTAEELLYEWSSIQESALTEKERVEDEADKIEEEKERANEAWANQMEEEDKALEEPSTDPAKDPNNIEWMQKYIEQEKQASGEDFGEDLNLDFDSSGQ